MVDTNILDLTLLGTSQSDRTTTMNTALQALEQATQRALAVDLTAGNATLTEAQYTRNFNFVCDGHLTNARTLTVPLSINAVTTVGRFFMVENLDTGVVTVQGATGATVAVAGGTRALIFNDGTDQKLIAVSAGVTTLAGLTDILLTGLADWEQLVYDATYGVWVNEPIPYILGIYIPQVVIDAELILSHVFDRDVTFPSGLTGSVGYANVLPTDTDQWLIRKNGGNIGTVNFTIASSAISFTFGSPTSFTSGDRLELVADYPSDATLAGVALTFRGTRTS
jgi:hypothetical protein